jgi:hypothetical protein
MGTISNNRVITHPAAPGVSAGTGIAFPSSSVVTGNTVDIFPNRQPIRGSLLCGPYDSTQFYTTILPIRNGPRSQ